MHSVIRMSEATALGLHAMAAMADHADERMSVHALAEAIDASAHHLSKVLQRLSRARLVRSVRGPGGGYALAKDPSQTSLLEIYELLEGPLSLSGCLFANSSCQRSSCIMGGLIDRVNHDVRDYLVHTTLDSLAERSCITDHRETPDSAS